MIEHDDFDVVLKDLRLSELIVIHVRDAEGITKFPGIVLFPWTDCIIALERFMRFVQLQAVRGVRQLMFRLPIVRHRLHATCP